MPVISCVSFLFGDHNQAGWTNIGYALFHCSPLRPINASSADHRKNQQHGDEHRSHGLGRERHTAAMIVNMLCEEAAVILFWVTIATTNVFYSDFQIWFMYDGEK